MTAASIMNRPPPGGWTEADRVPKTKRPGRKRSAATPAERAERQAAGKQKTADALERLDAACKTLAEDDDAFAEYLRLSARMHSYSWGNRLLVMVQRPDAGMVAGFKRWAELGRPVLKGSKGIQILAPMTYKRENEETGETEHRIGGFRVAYVFAVGDTDGPAVELPQPVPSTDDGPRAREVLAALEKRADQLGVPVEWKTDGFGDGITGPAGCYTHATGRITVNAALPAAAKAKTLAHELAHHVCGHTGNRADAETVAEGAAFVTAAFHELDTLGYSAPYIAGWAHGDVARIRTLLQNIAEVAAILTDTGKAAV